MKALFLVQGLEVAASRYRVLQYLPGLSAAGIGCAALRFPRGLLDLPPVLKEARQAEVLYLQRKQMGPLSLPILRRSARRVIYDFDDALWVRSSKHPDNRSRTRRRRFRRMVRAADLVVAGNSYLAEKASLLGRPVVVIPTPVDTSLYPLRPEGFDPRVVTVGWIGAHASVHYLCELMPVLEEAYRTDRRFRLKVVCSIFPDSTGLPMEKVRWQKETEVEEIRSMDIGIMPLIDDEWSRGKCGLKALQYLAAGVPVVATPVGVNADIVKDGGNGFWARTAREWIDRLLLLAGDPALRRRMGLQGRETVEKGYSLEACLPMMEEALRGPG
jgi:glycosyltransferase involved in cell wall biosynthesis